MLEVDSTHYLDLALMQPGRFWRWQSGSPSMLSVIVQSYQQTLSERCGGRARSRESTIRARVSLRKAVLYHTFVCARLLSVHLALSALIPRYLAEFAALHDGAQHVLRRAASKPCRRSVPPTSHNRLSTMRRPTPTRLGCQPRPIPPLP
jgi:hypothetical protein